MLMSYKEFCLSVYYDAIKYLGHIELKGEYNRLKYVYRNRVSFYSRFIESASNKTKTTSSVIRHLSCLNTRTRSTQVDSKLTDNGNNNFSLLV